MGSNVRRKVLRETVKRLRKERPDANITVDNLKNQLKEK